MVDGVQSVGSSDVDEGGARDGTAMLGQTSLWIQVGGNARNSWNGISVSIFKQWKGASTRENLDALRRVAETTGSGVAVWELTALRTRKN